MTEINDRMNKEIEKVYEVPIYCYCQLVRQNINS